jgi:hypothetical protein
VRAADESSWARDVAAALLAPLGQRWAHTLGVVERAHSFAGALPDSEFAMLLAAAYAHDIGYAPSVARTGFHPLDGAVFLRSQGRERLACLVAHHSGARTEAEERRLVEQLDEFPEEESLVADALTYCDLTRAADGSPTTAALRLDDVIARSGENDPVGRAVRRSRDDLLTRVHAVEALVSHAPRGA